MAGGIRILLIASRAAGALTEEAGEEAIRIARNVLSKRQDIPEQVRLDALGIFCEKFVLKWEQIDPNKNPGAYIGTMANNALTDLLRGFQRDLTAAEKLIEDPTHKKVEQPVYRTSRSLRDRMDGQDFRKLTIQQRLRIRKEVIRLRKSGLSIRVIAREIGVEHHQITRWLVMGLRSEKKRIRKGL